MSILTGDKVLLPEIRIQELFENNLDSKDFRNKIAMYGKSTTMTFDEVNRKANIAARNIVKKLSSSKPVLIHGTESYLIGLNMRPSPQRLVALLAIFKSGATYLPLDVDFPLLRTKFYLENSKAQAVLADEDDVLQTMADKLNGNTLVMDFKELVSSAPNSEDSNLTVGEELPTSKETKAPIGIIFTSGTTGNPKATPITHTNVLNGSLAVEGLRAPQKEVRQTSFFNIMSISFPVEVFSAWLNGHSLVIFPNEARLKVSLYTEMIKEYQVNRIFAITPTFCQNIRYMQNGGM